MGKGVTNPVYKRSNYIDRYLIGKTNYHQQGADWAAFGAKCGGLCNEYCRSFLIKAGLREEMGAADA